MRALEIVCGKLQRRRHFTAFLTRMHHCDHLRRKNFGKLGERDVELRAAAHIAADLRHDHIDARIFRLPLDDGECAGEREAGGQHRAQIAREHYFLLLRETREQNVPIVKRGKARHALVGEVQESSAFAANDLVEFEAILRLGNALVDFSVAPLCRVGKFRHCVTR